MLVGRPPFYHKHLEKMYSLILNEEVFFPKKSKLSDDCKDLLTRLLDKNPSTRLGSRTGLNEIKGHPFFKYVSFEMIMNKKIASPIIPNKDSSSDIANFDKEVTVLSPVLASISNKEIVKKHNEKFKDF